MSILKLKEIEKSVAQKFLKYIWGFYTFESHFSLLF